MLKSYVDRNSFLMKVSRAYRFCARHLLARLPLTNKLIVLLSSLDPEVPCHSVISKSLKTSSSYFSHYLTPQEQEQILLEIKDYCITENIYHHSERVDVWWNRQVKFPTLQKLARACLSIFHEPQVEGSFSKM